MAKGINHLATADSLFFGKGALDQKKTGKMVDQALAGCDDGELFLEYVQSEGLSFDDGKLKSASYDTTQGFGLRAVSGEATGFAHASAIDEQARACRIWRHLPCRLREEGSRRGDPPGAGKSRVSRRSRRRDAGRAGRRLVGDTVARGGRPRPGRRLPSQEDLDVHPPDGPDDRLARRLGGR